MARRRTSSATICVLPDDPSFDRRSSAASAARHCHSTSIAAGLHPEHARQELHVEAPAHPKRPLKGLQHERRRAHQLGAALRVVDRQTEQERGGGREDAADVVTGRPPADVAPEKLNTRPQHQLDVRIASTRTNSAPP
jgi:hypothetical protein